MAYEDIAQPTQPGAYWFRSESMTCEALVDVRWQDGELFACWLNQDMPLCRMKGHWRGPIPPSTGPGRHLAH